MKKEKEKKRRKGGTGWRKCGYSDEDFVFLVFPPLNEQAPTVMHLIHSFTRMHAFTLPSSSQKRKKYILSVQVRKLGGKNWRKNIQEFSLSWRPQIFFWKKKFLGEQRTKLDIFFERKKEEKRRHRLRKCGYSDEDFVFLVFPPVNEQAPTGMHLIHSFTRMHPPTNSRPGTARWSQDEVGPGTAGTSPRTATVLGPTLVLGPSRSCDARAGPGTAAPAWSERRVRDELADSRRDA